MKKCRQMADRKRAAKLFRANRENAKRRRWWRAVIVAPLKARGRNLRRLRRARLAMVLGW
ncbi:MAG: hypothetical protein ACK4PN_08485 [Allorhizobium sp.]